MVMYGAWVGVGEGYKTKSASERDPPQKRTATPKPSANDCVHMSRHRLWRSASLSPGDEIQRLKQREDIRSANAICACAWICACASSTACCNSFLSMEIKN